MLQRSWSARMADDGGYSLFRTGSTRDPLVGKPMWEKFMERDAPKMATTPPPLPRPNKSMFLSRQESSTSLISPLELN